MKNIKVKKSELIYDEIKKRYLVEYGGREFEIDKWIKNNYDLECHECNWGFTHEKDKQDFESLRYVEKAAFNTFVDDLDLYEDDIKS